jgi:hypothetical protein
MERLISWKASSSSTRETALTGRDTLIEVWVEKDALSGVLKRITHKYGIALMSIGL